MLVTPYKSRGRFQYFLHRHKKIWYLEEQFSLKGYQGTIRQILVLGFGREESTLFITNSQYATAREVIMNCTGRNGVENGIGTNVKFFKMENQSSDVRLNVDLDLTVTLIANSCYG